MNRLPELEYRAEFLRGWPEMSGLHMNYQSDDKTLTNGDLVLMTTDAKIKKCDVTNSVNVGIVVRGPADDKSVRVAGGIAGTQGTDVVGGGNTCIVLFGHYVTRTTAIDEAATFVPGDNVAASATGVFTKATGTASLGWVLEVETLANGKKALVILVR